MRVKEGYSYINEEGKFITCNKSYKINFKRYMPNGWNKLSEIIEVDKNEIDSLGYSTIINFYLPMLKNIDYEKDRDSISTLERALLLLIQTDSEKLRQIAQGNEIFEEFAEDVIEKSKELQEQGIESHIYDPHEDLSMIVSDINFL